MEALVSDFLVISGTLIFVLVYCVSLGYSELPTYDPEEDCKDEPDLAFRIIIYH